MNGLDKYSKEEPAEYAYDFKVECKGKRESKIIQRFGAAAAA